MQLFASEAQTLNFCKHFRSINAGEYTRLLKLPRIPGTNNTEDSTEINSTVLLLPEVSNDTSEISWDGMGDFRFRKFKSPHSMIPYTNLSDMLSLLIS